MEDVRLLDSSVEEGVTAPSVEPPKGFVARHQRKFAASAVLLIVIVLSLFDVWYGLIQKSGLGVNSAELSFISNSDSDARLIVNGQMATKSYLSSLSVDNTFCALQYSDNGDTSAPWQDLAEITGTMKKSSNDKFSLTIALKDVAYSPLRHLLSDTYWNSPTGASIKCHAGVKLYLYHAIPVHLYTDVEVSLLTSTPGVMKLHYASSGVSGTGAFKFSKDVEILQEKDKKNLDVNPIIRYLRKLLRPFEKWMQRNIRQVYDEQAVGIHVRMKNPMDTSAYLSSFFVTVPALSVATTLLGDEESGGRYHFSSSAFEMQFSAPELALDVDLSLLCSDSFDAAAPQKSELHACDLFDATGSRNLWSTLNSGLLSIVMDSANQRSFLSELAGPHHTLLAQTVDMDDVEAKLATLLDQDASSTASSAAVSARSGNGFVTTKDPRISTGGKCVTGTADNVYDSYTCAVVEKGFFKLYLYIFDSEGFLTKIQILTSWAPSAPFAAATEAEVVTRGNYVTQWNSTISEMFQNASLSVRYDDNGITKMRSEAVTQWDFLNAVEEGSADFTGYIEIPTDRADLTTGFKYGDNAYSTYIAAIYNSSAEEAGVRAYAHGDYFGGDIFHWSLSLNESAAFVDNVKQGDANGFISSETSSTGNAAHFNFRLLANDGLEIEQLYTDNQISWESDYLWKETGTLSANSVLRLVNTIDWNAEGVLQYADHAYNFLVHDLSQDGSSKIFDAEGNGKYGGDWYNWYASLLQSSVITNDVLYGNATGLVSSALSANGDAAILVASARAVDGQNVEQTFTNNNISWSSASSWTETGSVAANSVFYLINSVGWNAHTSLDYADDRYTGRVSETDLMGTQNLLAYAMGAYGGTWTDWFGTIDESALFWGYSKIGSALGELAAQVDTEGIRGNVELTGNVFDGSDLQIITTNDTVQWYSELGNWMEKGTIKAASEFLYPTVAVWNTTGYFNYGDHAYQVSAADISGDGSSLFNMYALGGYGGTWQHWWATLTESAVYFGDSKLGDAVGRISSAVGYAGEAAYFTLFTLVNDGNEMEQVYTNNNVSWYSPQENWLAAGSLTATTVFRLVESLNWNALGLLQYGSHNYRVDSYNYYVDGSMMFLAHAVGGYGGNWNNWFASVTESFLYITGTKVGDMTGLISAAVDASGDTADMVLNVRVNDGNDVQQLLTKNSIDWSSSAEDWLKSGAIAAATTVDLINTVNFTGTGAMNYGDHLYNLDVRVVPGIEPATVAVPSDNIFEMHGEGGFGGNWNNWWASLTNSDIYVGDSKFGDAVGLIRSEVTSSGDVAEIAFYTLVNDGSEMEQLYTNNTIDWSTTSTWDQAGYMSVSSALRLVDSVNWVANGYLQYADHAYSLKAAEFAIDGFNNFLVNGNGRYGGNWNSWWASLTESAVYLSENLFGTATGYISSDVTTSLDTGVLTFSALAFDGSEVPVMELSTNNTVTWASPIADWLTQGDINITSTTQVADILDWDAAGLFHFNNGNYSIAISGETLDGTPVFLVEGKGQYGGTFGRWYISVVDSVCYISDERQGSMNTRLEWLTADMFQTALGRYDLNVAGGEDEPLFQSSNILTWFDTSSVSNHELTQGTVYTDTSVNGEQVFLLFSQFALDQTNRTASFAVTEILDGVLGLSATAEAFYAENYGLLTGINAKVSYNSELIFEAHTTVDAQLETIMSEPTPAPTQAPSVAPTNAPTLAPSSIPSKAPTRAPSAVPTMTVTAAPTQAPSAGPTKQNTPILSFSSNITLEGVTTSTLDLASQQALINVTASSMNVAINSVSYLGSTMVSSTGRRYLKSQKHHYLTSFVVVSKMKVSVPVESSDPTASNDLYTSLTTQLNNAVTTGTFTTNLQKVSTALGTTETSHASATAVSNSAPETSAPPASDGGKEGLSGGAIAGIVIGALAGLAILAGAAYYCFFVKGGSTNNAANDAGTSKTTRAGEAPEVFTSENPIAATRKV